MLVKFIICHTDFSRIPHRSQSYLI